MEFALLVVGLVRLLKMETDVLRAVGLNELLVMRSHVAECEMVENGKLLMTLTDGTKGILTYEKLEP